MPSKIYIGLVHYPIYDKRHAVVASAVTNFDLHDIARTARTFGVNGFYMITPLESQIQLIQRILHHWTDGKGSIYNATRKESFSLVRIAKTIEEASEEISISCERQTLRVATGAKSHPGSLSFGEMRRIIEGSEAPFFILFGTGWGLTHEVKESCDYILTPIEGRGYNHLPVRAAVAIILDRLLGDRVF
jgi:hypothetical protein